MGIPGKQSSKGKGEKEPDGSVRDSLLKVKLPSWKLLKLKELAANQGRSLTDLISQIIGQYLNQISDSAEYPTQQNDGDEEG